MTLYKAHRLLTAKNERKAMANRLGVSEEDVIFAAWEHSKSVIGARLKRDLRDKKHER